MRFGLMLRAQFPEGDDMSARFQELLQQARLADALGFDSITKGMHYSSPPWQSLQQLPFLSRVMAEAPRLRLNFGLILLSLHKPLDVAEQIATVDVMSGGKVIFGVALGYRDVEFLAFGNQFFPLLPDFQLLLVVGRAILHLQSGQFAEQGVHFLLNAIKLLGFRPARGRKRGWKRRRRRRRLQRPALPVTAIPPIRSWRHGRRS